MSFIANSIDELLRSDDYKYANADRKLTLLKRLKSRIKSRFHINDVQFLPESKRMSQRKLISLGVGREMNLDSTYLLQKLFDLPSSHYYVDKYANSIVVKSKFDGKPVIAAFYTSKYHPAESTITFRRNLIKTKPELRELVDVAAVEAGIYNPYLTYAPEVLMRETLAPTIVERTSRAAKTTYHDLTLGLRYIGNGSKNIAVNIKIGGNRYARSGYRRTRSAASKTKKTVSYAAQKVASSPRTKKVVSLTERGTKVTGRFLYHRLEDLVVGLYNHTHYAREAEARKIGQQVSSADKTIESAIENAYQRNQEDEAKSFADLAERNVTYKHIFIPSTMFHYERYGKKRAREFLIHNSPYIARARRSIAELRGRSLAAGNMQGIQAANQFNALYDNLYATVGLPAY